MAWRKNSGPWSYFNCTLKAFSLGLQKNGGIGGMVGGLEDEVGKKKVTS